MTYKSRMYLVCVLLAGLIAPALRAEDKTPVSYLLVGCVVVGVVAYKINDYFNPTHVRLTKLEEGLAAFKKETADNFNGVLKGQVILTDGQGKLAEGQQQLQEQVAATHKEVEDVHAKTTRILEDTTSLKVSAHVFQQRIDDINAKLERQIETIAKLTIESRQAHEKTQGQLGRIESSMIKKDDMPGISKDLALMIERAIQKESERMRAGHFEQRALDSEPHDYGTARTVAASAQKMLKQTT